MVRAQQAASAVMHQFGLETCTLNAATCSLANTGQTGFMCRKNSDCCENNPGGACKAGDDGLGISCAGHTSVDAPCHAGCPSVARYPPHAGCQSCGLPFVRTQPYGTLAPPDAFAPWAHTQGWDTYPGYRSWSGCVCQECVTAAASFNVTGELALCPYLNADEVDAHFPNGTETRRQCALLAACNVDGSQPAGLGQAHEAMRLQCETFGEKARDACVGCVVSTS